MLCQFGGQSRLRGSTGVVVDDRLGLGTDCFAVAYYLASTQFAVRRKLFFAFCSI
jgi:hypothetical protein